MKYKIYHKSTGHITGILSEDELSNKSDYESQIDYDSVIDLESDISEQVIFFNYSIDVENAALVSKESNERKVIRELKTARSNRKDEYPDIGEQLDMLYHAIDSNSDLKTKFSSFYTSIKAVKDKYPKSS